MCVTFFFYSFIHSFTYLIYSLMSGYNHSFALYFFMLSALTDPSQCQAGHTGRRDRELNQAGLDPQGLLVLVGEILRERGLGPTLSLISQEEPHSLGHREQGVGVGVMGGSLCERLWI